MFNIFIDENMSEEKKETKSDKLLGLIEKRKKRLGDGLYKELIEALSEVHFEEKEKEQGKVYWLKFMVNKELTNDEGEKTIRLGILSVMYCVKPELEAYLIKELAEGATPIQEGMGFPHNRTLFQYIRTLVPTYIGDHNANDTFYLTSMVVSCAKQCTGWHIRDCIHDGRV